MKIGITCYPTYGGSGVVATELGKELARLGNEVHFVSYAMPYRLKKFQENIYFHEVEFSNYPLFEHQLYTLALASKMIEVAENHKIDLFHVHYAIPHAMSACMAKKILATRGYEIKIISTLHGTDITLVGLEPSFMPLVKFSIEESDGVTAVSQFLKDKTKTAHQTNKDIQVIYNFIDTELYKPKNNETSKSHFAPNGEKILIHTSNFRPVKRVADTIRVLKLVNDIIPAKLLLIGDGPDRSECERLTKELKLENKVTFLGKQDGIEDLLFLGDVFFLPSETESFGLAALEAMACGVPIICTNIGGLSELNIQNKTGYLTDVGDVETMAKNTIDLLSDEGKHKQFKEACRNRAVNQFNKNLIIQKYLDYYKEILSK
ncbi:MAG: N-acetyl-alpha-D-glucosaminyl L-malate synthase BshA [Ignavibacteriales bacterium]|nr:N-acetyl-alpha-D-glucosaminyl L-malate synthase BshA [Ignavibacteriales bacterium]